MSTTSTNLGLTIWNSASDLFDYTALAQNWKLIDDQFSTDAVGVVPIKFIQKGSTLPTTPNDGELFYLLAFDSTEQFDVGLYHYRAGAGQWYCLGQPELISGDLPTDNNFTGRVVVCQTDVGDGFKTGEILVFDGSDYVRVGGGLTKVATVDEANGSATNGDAFLLETRDTIVNATATTADIYAGGNSILIRDTSTSYTEQYRVISALPPGTIQMFAGSIAPDGGWLLCDGRAISRTTFKDLFDVIGTSYGIGDGSNTFNIPDLRGRVPVGLGSHPSVNLLGADEGVDDVANRRPQHQHTKHQHTLPRQQIELGTRYGQDYSFYTGWQFGNYLMNVRDEQTHTELVSSVDGGSESVTDSLDAPSYVVVNYIIKV